MNVRIKRGFVRLFAGICLLSLTFATQAMANTLPHASKALEISQQCSAHFARAERKYGIPKHLLTAIALTESGRYHKELRKVIPWPWTLNIEGQGSYYSSLHDAATAINRAKQSGKRSIDVGCMQVNLKHHPKAFVSTLDALTPASNVDYAASFLRANYDELGSWTKAIAAYHSRSSKGNKYYAMVQKRWRDVRLNANDNYHTEYASARSSNQQMVNGVRVTSLRRRATSQAERGNTPTSFNIAVNDRSKTYTVPESTMPRGTPDMPRASSIKSKPVDMKVIQVRDYQPTDNTVVIIKPTVNQTTGLDFVTKPASTSHDTSHMVKKLNVSYQANQHHPQQSVPKDVPAPKPAASQQMADAKPSAVPISRPKHAPNFIFGREE